MFSVPGQEQFTGIIYLVNVIIIAAKEDPGWNQYRVAGP